MADIVPISLEQADLRRAVRQIADKYGHRYFVECATSHKEPTELYGELGAGGFLGVHLPEGYGGGGAGLGELTAVIEEVSAAGCPLLMMVIAPAICGSIIAAHGSPELKRAWLPGLADGTRTMSFAITEPEAGSNTHALATTARRSGDVYVISGTKYWISCAVLLDGQVPHVPGVPAMVPQHRFLGGGGQQPVPAHANTLSNTADNSGEVKRRSLPRPKAGAPTPRSS